MKAIFVLLVFTFTGLSAAQASWATYMANTYSCDNSGKEYISLRHVVGGYNEPTWTFVGLCDPGLLKKEEYGGRVLSIDDAHSDIQACARQIYDTGRNDIADCTKEFQNKNGIRGQEGQRLVGTVDGLPRVERKSDNTTGSEKFKEAFKPYTNQ